MMETAFPTLRPLKWMGCITHTSIQENKIDSTATPYRAPSLLSETMARTCTELILKECEIEELPELIGMYYLLRVLDVSENKLTELPPDVGSCWSLRVLDFSCNQIKVIPDEIQQLPYLESLCCYGNRILEIPEWIGNLPLQEFNAFNNNVVHLPLSLGKLSSATSINIACNKCMQLSDNVMEKWDCVTKLNMYDCRLLKMGTFGHMLQLEQLRLFNNNLKTVPDFGGAKLPKLHLIELNRNHISEVPLSFFKSLPALQKCILNNNNIEKIPTGIDCPKLERLILGENRITELPPDLPLLGELKVLFLNGNQLQTIPETFVRAKGLTRVNLAKNSKLSQTSMHILVAIKKSCDANKGQYWAPDTLG